MFIAGGWAEHIKDGTPELKPASAVSPVGSILKRSFSIANNLTPSVPNSSLVPTVSLQNETAKALRALKQREWEEDQERQRKKARREQGASGVSGPGPATPGTDASTPGTPAGGDASGEKKMTAKESRKQQASKIEEAASHRAANATANMMMGGFGGSFRSKKKKTYSWMNAGGAAAPGAQPMGIGPPRPAGVPGAVDNSVSQTGASDNLQWTGQRLGVWREDMERGKGIQIRDWVGSLEGDDRAGAKSVYKAYLRMK